MPYIPQTQRDLIDHGRVEPFGEGELNYLITQEINAFLDRTPRQYADYNAVIGVLESVKLELYRRVVARYEDEKRLENGDVF
ncbi:MAG TPA: hypothetical protein VII06_04765 [Chloroflexota bacterium]|jgi:hypothetical protein